MYSTILLYYCTHVYKRALGVLFSRCVEGAGGSHMASKSARGRAAGVHTW